MKNLTWQNPEQLFVAQELINKVKSKCCGIKDKVKSLRGYISLLTACKKAKEVGEVVATMCQNEEAIDADLIAKKDFIHLLLPFLTNVKTGKGVDNLRLYINNAWDARKKAIRQSNR